MKKILEGSGMFKHKGKLFIKGAGSIFNIFGRYITGIYSGSLQDAAAIRSDWYSVGNDIKDVIGNGK